MIEAQILRSLGQFVFCNNWSQLLLIEHLLHERHWARGSGETRMMKGRWFLSPGSHELVENADTDKSGSPTRAASGSSLRERASSHFLYSQHLEQGLLISRCLAVPPSDLGRRIQCTMQHKSGKANVLKNTQLPWSLRSGVQCWLSMTQNPKHLL